MLLHYNGTDFGVFYISFKHFRKFARKHRLKYVSLSEGEWLEVWGEEDACTLKTRLR